MEGIQRKALIIMVGPFFFFSAHTMAINRVSFTRKFSTLIIEYETAIFYLPVR